MANYWSRKGWEITVITYCQNGEDFYQLTSDISRIKLTHSADSSGILESIWGNIKRVIALRSQIKKSNPDIVLSFMDTVNVLTLISSAALQVPIVVAERIDPRYHTTKLAWRILRSIAYPTASALVVQTKSTLEWASKKVGKKKSNVIPNPVFISEQINKKHPLDFPQPYVLAVGRLESQKGFDMLINAFDKVSKRYPEWTLVILGEGKERANLEEQISKFGKSGSIFLPGNYQNPYSVMSNASLFVLSSRFEGFPNVILESMALGTPVISFNCPSGPSEIIQNGENGILVPANDLNALEKAMIDLMSNPELRSKISENGKKVIDTFSTEKVMSQWESLFNKVRKA